jgi:hypothetical protein
MSSQNINNTVKQTGGVTVSRKKDEIVMDEDDYIQVDYSEFDYEFDNFMDLTDEFNYNYPGIFVKHTYIEFYNVLKRFKSHPKIWNMEDFIGDYIFSCISIFFDDDSFEKGEKHRFASYLYNYLKS